MEDKKISQRETATEIVKWCRPFSFCTVLGLLFIGLKLGKIISWSWWWITAPFWLGYTVSIIFFLTLLVVIMICAVIVIIAKTIE